MKKHAVLAALAVAFAFLPSFPLRAQDPHHAVLLYLSDGPITSSGVHPLLAYEDPSGRAQDWMFDAVIVTSYTLYHHTDGGITYPRSTDITDYTRWLFDEGQLATLASTVAGLRTELGDPSYRLLVYLTAPYFSGADANANTQVLIDGFAAAGLEELELVGFYWGYAEGLEGTDPAVDIGHINNTADYLHGLGYELIWIPMNHPDYVDGWLSSCRTLGCRFDRVTLQVGYAFVPSEPERFADADDRIHTFGLEGIEIEFGYGSDLDNARMYLSQADRLDWTENPLTTYYYGTVIAGFPASSTLREIYDGLYRFIAAHPRQSVLPHLAATLTDDTFVDEASDHRTDNHGDAIYLNMGTNSYPNAQRTYLLFDAGAAIDPVSILAAHLHMSRVYFPYGTVVEDGRLYLVADTGWDEMALTGATEPAASSLTLIGAHRYVNADETHGFDVTDEVRSTLSSGSSLVSFMLRRQTEDGALSEIQLSSKEAGAAASPTLEIVCIPADAGTDPDATDTGPDDPSPPDMPDADIPPDAPADDSTDGIDAPPPDTVPDTVTDGQEDQADTPLPPPDAADGPPPEGGPASFEGGCGCALAG
jgi:hypothetical protein